MFLMSLHICTKFSAHMLVIIKVLASHDVAQREGFRDAIRVQEYIEPEYSIL